MQAVRKRTSQRPGHHSERRPQGQHDARQGRYTDHHPEHWNARTPPAAQVEGHGGHQNAPIHKVDQEIDVAGQKEAQVGRARTRPQAVSPGDEPFRPSPPLQANGQAARRSGRGWRGLR